MVAIPLVFELVLLSLITLMLRQSEYEAWKANQTKLVIAMANRLTNMYYEMGMVSDNATNKKRISAFRPLWESGQTIKLRSPNSCHKYCNSIASSYAL